MLFLPFIFIDKNRFCVFILKQFMLLSRIDFVDLGNTVESAYYEMYVQTMCLKKAISDICNTWNNIKNRKVLTFFFTQSAIHSFFKFYSFFFEKKSSLTFFWIVEFKIDIHNHFSIKYKLYFQSILRATKYTHQFFNSPEHILMKLILCFPCRHLKGTVDL